MVRGAVTQEFKPPVEVKTGTDVQKYWKSLSEKYAILAEDPLKVSFHSLSSVVLSVLKY